VRDLEATLVESLSERKVGRPPKGMPTTLAEAQERIRELQRQYEQEATKREELYCRSELMAIRLKWPRSRLPKGGARRWKKSPG